MTLGLDTPVYTVCKYYIQDSKDFKLYVTRKTINGIKRNRDGSVEYTAGKYNELVFKEVGENCFVSFKPRKKNVYLKKSDADKEMNERLERFEKKTEDKARP